MIENPRFLIAANTGGGLVASFVFQNYNEYNQWLQNELPLLEKKYGRITTFKHILPGLAIGDKCHVAGEGSEVFTITGIVEYEPYRYGFVLDSGDTEEVSKCWRPEEI